MTKNDIFEKFTDKKISTAELIEEFRALSHSIEESTRAKAVEVLSGIPDEDAQRELLNLYQATHWRDTKVKILQNLWCYPNQRTIEFLIQIARDESDIALCEEAIWSLGKSENTIAAAFLVRFYSVSSEVLKPFLVSAIGQISSHALVPEFLTDLEKALKNNNISLAKNLILTLAELKAISAIPIILPLINSATHKTLLLSAILGFSRLSREGSTISILEEFFRYDLFEYELLKSAQTQLTFRSEWTIEDYLNKIFTAERFHKMLPFEINTFSESDVEAGISLFEEEKYTSKKIKLFASMHFKDMHLWYDKLVVENFKKTDFIDLFQSIQHHYGKDFEPLLNKFSTSVLAAKDKDILESYLSAVALTLPNSEQYLIKTYQNNFSIFTDELTIVLLNTISIVGIVNQSNQKSIKFIGKIIEDFLDNASANIQSRALRALGQILYSSNVVNNYVKSNIQNSAVIDSILYYCEKCPSKFLSELLLIKNDLYWATPNKSHALLKALSQQVNLDLKDKRLEQILESSLTQSKDLELQRLSLLCLSKHSLHQLNRHVEKLLQSSEQIKIYALIAAKSLKLESFAEPVYEILLEKNSPSVLARALDTLTSINGLRAKSLTIDFLEKNLMHNEYVEKIARSLTAPSVPNPGLAQRLKKIILANKNPKIFDELSSLHERFLTGQNLNDLTPHLEEKELENIDNLLKNRIQKFSSLDEQAKAALRAAEVPFSQTQFFEGRIDKSMSVVLYCKSLDIMLEKHYGKQFLIPKLEAKLHEFQNRLHLLGLNTDNPNAQFIIRALKIDKFFMTDNLPLNKMTLLARDFLSGRIVNNHWKSIDGLRAWASLMIIFSRTICIDGMKEIAPLIPLSSSDDAVASFCKRLLALQDARNPVAHRQTIIRFADVEKIREEATLLFSSLTNVLLT